MPKTPNMQLHLPVPGQTPAGEWGGKLNQALEQVDAHDHTQEGAANYSYVALGADGTLAGFDFVRFRPGIWGPP